MDGIIVIVLALVLFIRYPVKGEAAKKIEPVRVERPALKPTLNPEMIHDENAFMRIANELGFY